MRQENNMQIYLIGFMGSGKTSTGTELAKLMDRELLDSDELIVQQEGKSIPEIFAESGEEGFRKIETEIFRNLSQNDNDYIISCGGGAPLREENVALMRRNGRIVRLTATAQTVYDRVKGDDNRPLLQSDDPMKRIRALMSMRERAYSEAADITVSTDGRTPLMVATELARILTK